MSVFFFCHKITSNIKHQTSNIFYFRKRPNLPPHSSKAEQYQRDNHQFNYNHKYNHKYKYNTFRLWSLELQSRDVNLIQRARWTLAGKDAVAFCESFHGLGVSCVYYWKGNTNFAFFLLSFFFLRSSFFFRLLFYKIYVIFVLS